MKLKVTIKPHSAVDVITNSSTEIFCSIKSANFIYEIAKELSSILEYEVKVNIDNFNTEDIPQPIGQIDFWMEYSDDESVKADFRKLIEYILTQKFGEDNFEIFVDSW